MANGLHPCAIHTAFPHFPSAALGRLLGDLSPLDPIDSLLASDGASSVFESIADLMLCEPSAGVGTTLPGLWVARDEAIGVGACPVRIATALARLDIAVWGEVLDLTPSFLLDIKGFGEGGLRHFLAAAVRTSAEACSRQSPPAAAPTLDLFAGRVFPPRGSFSSHLLGRLVQWGTSEAGAVTVDDLRAACSRQLPDDIALVFDALREARLADLFPAIARCETLGSLAQDLLGVLDRRSRSVFCGRISTDGFRTLEELAIEFGISRERVRQLSIRADERIREALKTPRFAPIGWRAHTLRIAIGTAVPGDGLHYGDATREITRDVSDEAREGVLDLLLWLAGPYARDPHTGWIGTGEPPGPGVVDTFSDGCGRVDIDRLRQHLSDRGISRSVHDAWLDGIGKVKSVEGHWLHWIGNFADKAARLLEIWARPATPEEIVGAIGEGHGVRATRSRLFEDERFVRVDLARVALRSWGLEEYSTIAEEIDRELGRRGGTADLDDLVAALVVRFRLREASVRFFGHAPMFVLDGGTIRRRTVDDPRSPVPSVAETPACYTLAPDTLAWRVGVTADTLRGSGRHLPPAIADWLGVAPGGRRSLTTDGGGVGITWPETSAFGPSLGSIRLLVERAEAGPGDRVLLRFGRDGGTLSLARIDPAALDLASASQRLRLLTGIASDGEEGDLPRDLGRALGVPPTWDAIGTALLERGESELAALVPTESEPLAFDASKDLF